MLVMSGGASHDVRIRRWGHISFLRQLFVAVDCLRADLLRVLDHEVESVREARAFIHLTTLVNLSLGD